jgi:hypothetical protein
MLIWSEEHSSSGELYCALRIGVRFPTIGEVTKEVARRLPDPSQGTIVTRGHPCLPMHDSGERFLRRGQKHHFRH